MMRSGGGFSPASLFAGGTEGAEGVWLDRSDIDTLFQDSAGATPVTASGQPVRLMLDKSQGLVLGPDLVPSAASWNGSANWTVNAAAGRATLVSSLDSNDDLTLGTLTGSRVGDLFAVSFTIESISGGGVLISSSRASGPSAYTSAGTYTYFLSVIFMGSGALSANISIGGVSCVISGISVRLLPGNHAAQSTAGLTSRYQTGPDRSQYDGADDFSPTPYLPTLAGTIAVRMNSTTASRVAFGSKLASNGNCYIGLASDGSLAGGIGEHGTGVIKGSADIRGVWTTGILTWNGTTVTLYQDGVTVYSAAQSGAVNTTIAMHEGGLNNNGTASSFTLGGIAQSIVLDRVMTASEIASITNLWSTIS